MTRLSLLVLAALASPLAAQQPAPRGMAGVAAGPVAQPLPIAEKLAAFPDTNWVDTITVGRLPTGGCEWAQAWQKLRTGKAGTTTTTGKTSEKTCRVLIYNITTGTAMDIPLVETEPYVQDADPPTLPKGTVLNAADTLTVGRLPDGECDWGQLRFRMGPKGSSVYIAAVRVTTCWAVVHNVTIPHR
jgi:hypothetical protein